MPLPVEQPQQVGGRRRLARRTAARAWMRGVERMQSTRAARRSTAPRRCRRRAPAVRRRPAPAPSTAVDTCVPLISASPSFGAERRPAARPARLQRVAAGSASRPSHTSPSPIEHEREVRQRREVAAGADRAAARHARMDAAVEQREQRLERLDADAGEALRQHVGAQRHRRAHRAHRQRLADAGGVAAQQVELQRARDRRGRCASRRRCRSRC